MVDPGWRRAVGMRGVILRPPSFPCHARVHILYNLRLKVGLAPPVSFAGLNAH